MSISKHVYRVGDRIKIINPRIVKRVGYPLLWTDLVDEFVQHPELLNAMRLLGIINPDSLAHTRVSKDFAIGCAKAAVRARGFGGPDRTLHYDDSPTFKINPGDITVVLDKRCVQTGKYYPPHYGYDSYYGEYDYEPGGLDERKTLILLTTPYGEIDSADVEPTNEELE